MKINEGLQTGDLNFVIKPIISIDEYESKIDDRKAIVVGLFTNDKDPAIELARFIEKSSIQVLDTDVSPAPTIDGYYVAFIEFDRNASFVTKLLDIIKEIDNLTNVKHWKFVVYNDENKNGYPLNKKELLDKVNLDPNSIEVGDNEDENLAVDSDDNTDKIEELNAFFKNSLVESIKINKNEIEFVTSIFKNKYTIVEYNNTQPSMPIIICELQDPKLTESIRLQNILGNYYEVYVVNEGFLITNDSSFVILSK